MNESIKTNALNQILDSFDIFKLSKSSKSVLIDKTNGYIQLIIYLLDTNNALNQNVDRDRDPKILERRHVRICLTCLVMLLTIFWPSSDCYRCLSLMIAIPFMEWNARQMEQRDVIIWWLVIIIGIMLHHLQNTLCWFHLLILRAYNYYTCLSFFTVTTSVSTNYIITQCLSHSIAKFYYFLMRH